MAVTCVDGQGTAPHITGADKGRLHAGVFGEVSVVMAVGKRLEATQEGANRVTIATGDAILHGRHVSVTAPEQVTITSGTQGQNRNDFICLKYERDSHGIESAKLEVLRGVPTTGEAKDPLIPAGSVLNGDAQDYFPIYRVKLNGVVASKPEVLFHVANVLNSDDEIDILACYQPADSAGTKVFWRAFGNKKMVTVQAQIFMNNTSSWTTAVCPFKIPEGYRFTDCTNRIKEMGGNTGIDSLNGDMLSVQMAMRDSDNANVHLNVKSDGSIYAQNMGGVGHSSNWRWGTISYAVQR